ncbi:FecR domain-containing protein [Neorhodopirellula pilleata]|uniref:FecR protein n=1 Tax=Neorhodopirellula pilleata TaxID=2714738 RepID=A0A5C5ZZ38_9BACT|nr:FecR domain-containing protein [Neorhodopirellula pilleata]TWT92228.1 FecR protein [Neorhodopirellula pilleata]
MHSDFQSLISAMCDNRATDAELAHLADLLRNDPTARDEYLRYVDLHSALSDEALPTFDSDVIDYRIRDNHTPTVGGRIAGWSPTMRWFVIAVSVAIIVGIDFVASRQPPTNAVVDNNGPSITAALPLATILLAEDCHWQGDDLKEGSRLNPGRLGLDRGTAVLRFDGGAELVLVGPATIDLRSAASVVVELGDIVVQATDGAEGFVVMTPTSEVIDLGTEFAVKVARSGATEVHVLDGEVSYRRINATQQLSKILRAGEGVAIDDDGRPTAVPMNSPRFQEFVNRVNPRSRADLLIAYEGFNYSPGVLPLEESTVGKGWAGPWRKRMPDERQAPVEDDSPDHFEIVHAQMNVTWPVPGGRLGMLKLPPGRVFYVRSLMRSLDLDREGVTFFSLMARETERRTESHTRREDLRLTFRSSTDYFSDSISFGHSVGFQPRVMTGSGVFHTSPLVLPAEQTTLWIGKIVSRSEGEDEIYFRIYGEEDVLGYAEPATWHVVTRGVDMDAHLDRVLLSSTGSKVRLVDELRIGPTWRSVAPMQETK